MHTPHPLWYVFTFDFQPLHMPSFDHADFVEKLTRNRGQIARENSPGSILRDRCECATSHAQDSPIDLALVTACAAY